MNKVNLNAYVSKSTKERFDKIKKDCPLRNDAFINYLLNLYEGKDNNIMKEQGGKENE